MNRLGDEELSGVEGVMVTRHRQTGMVTALAYNYPKEVPEALPKTASVDQADKIVATGSARPLTITINGLPAQALFSVETLDVAHGNAVLAWEQMGRPEPPNRAETEQLRNAAWSTKRETVRADESGKLVLSRPLDAWSLVLLDQLSLPVSPANY